MINSGLSEFVSQNDDEYVKKAIYFATKGKERLSYLRANMREYIKDKPVFNTALLGM